MHTERGCTRTLEIVKSLLLYKLLSQFIRLPEMPDQVRLLKVSKPQCYSTERLPQGPKLGGLHSNTTHHNKYKVPTHTTAVGHCTHSHGTAIGTHKTPAGLHTKPSSLFTLSPQIINWLHRQVKTHTHTRTHTHTCTPHNRR